MKRVFGRLLIPISMILLAMLACTFFVGGPEYPTNSISTSTEEVGNFYSNLQNAQTLAVQTGTIIFSINETQLTSLVSAALESQNDALIEKPQIYLRNGEITAYGKVTQGNIQANVRIILTLLVNENSQPEITVSSADFGPIKIPEGFNDTFETLIQQVLTGSIVPAATGFRLENIILSDGVLTFSGRIR